MSLKHLIKNSSRLSFELVKFIKMCFVLLLCCVKNFFFNSFSASSATGNVIWLQALEAYNERLFQIHQAFHSYLLGLRTLHIKENKKLRDSLKLSGYKVVAKCGYIFQSFLNGRNLESVVFLFCFNACNSCLMEKTEIIITPKNIFIHNLKLD